VRGQEIRKLFLIHPLGDRARKRPRPHAGYQKSAEDCQGVGSRFGYGCGGCPGIAPGAEVLLPVGQVVRVERVAKTLLPDQEVGAVDIAVVVEIARDFHVGSGRDPHLIERPVEESGQGGRLPPKDGRRVSAIAMGQGAGHVERLGHLVHGQRQHAKAVGASRSRDVHMHVVPRVQCQSALGKTDQLAAPFVKCHRDQLARVVARAVVPQKGLEWRNADQTLEIPRAGQVVGIEGETIQLGTGKTVSIGELFATACEALDVQAKVVQDPQRIRPKGSEVMVLLSDPQKAKDVLKWEPQVDLKTGLKKTADWIEQNLNRFDPQKYQV